MKASVSLYIQSPEKNYGNTSKCKEYIFQTYVGYRERIFYFIFHIFHKSISSVNAITNHEETSGRF